jgi:hypothetical protein
MWIFVCLSRKANPLLDDSESWNLADLKKDHPNQRETFETWKIMPQGVLNVFSKKNFTL